MTTTQRKLVPMLKGWIDASERRGNHDGGGGGSDADDDDDVADA